MAFGAMAFVCNRIFRLRVLSLFRLLAVKPCWAAVAAPAPLAVLLFRFRWTVDMPAVVADECVGLFWPVRKHMRKY